MNKIQKINEIKELWLSQEREIAFDTIEWDGFTIDGHSYQKSMEMITKSLEREGYYFWYWAKCDGSGWLDWEWALLIHLSSWYRLPDELEAVLLVDEKTMAVCIVSLDFVDGLDRLFHAKHAWKLGLEILSDERKERDRSAKLNFTPPKKPVSASEALGFLMKP